LLYRDLRGKGEEERRGEDDVRANYSPSEIVRKKQM
jgi:hypothetical protein